MIQLTRLNSQAFALNTDLIERIEETPDTVLTLIDGTRYVVKEPVDDVIERVISFRARVVERATEDHVGAELHVISDHRTTENGAGTDDDLGGSSEAMTDDSQADGLGDSTTSEGD